jgi:hypothetical protein
MRRLASLLCLLAVGGAALADVPVRVEQLIYSIEAFNGGDYSATFALQTADTIFLVAGADNLLSVRKTLVYWWSITSQWKTDTDTLNVPFDGTLEITGPGAKVQRIALRKLTYFSTVSDNGEQWHILFDADADREVQRAQRQSDDYFAAVTAYQKATAQYDARVQEIGDRVAALKAAGKDAAAAAAELEALARPLAPVQSSMYGTAPEPAQSWFVVNLPAGTYTMRMLDADGNVVEGSDKRLVVFSWRRTGGIGYEVIPSDKWTRPEESKTPSSVLSVNGSANLYVRPFTENEANDLFYEKMTSNQAPGNASLFKWVRKADVSGAVLIAARPGGTPAPLGEQAFIVKQAPGSTLGYTIAPWDPATAATEAAPSLIAFPVIVEKASPMIGIHLTRSGVTVTGSERQIRVVTPRAGFGWYALLALAPLLAFALVLILRAVRLRPPQ